MRRAMPGSLPSRERSPLTPNKSVARQAFAPDPPERASIAVGYHSAALVLPLLSYSALAVLLLSAVHRLVLPLSRRAAVILFLVPFAFCGYELIAGRVYAPVDLPYATEPLRGLASQHGVTAVSTGMHSDVYTEFIPWRKSVPWSLVRERIPYSGRGERGPLTATRSEAALPRC